MVAIAPREPATQRSIGVDQTALSLETLQTDDGMGELLETQIRGIQVCNAGLYIAALLPTKANF
jgi:hypothetical protein